MIKSKNSKKALSILLVLIMVFAFSSNAFAATPGTVDVVVTINGTPATYANRTIDGVDDTVYDVADRLGLVDDETWSPAVEDYSPLFDPNDPLYGHFSQEAVYVTELDGNRTAPYDSPYFDEDDFYEEGIDTKLDLSNAEVLAQQPGSGGLGMYYGDGYWFTDNMQFMVYIGDDITYEVDFADDGPNNVKGLPVDPSDPYGRVIPGKPVTDPAYDNYFMYAMNECLLSDGDIVYLNYGPIVLVF